MVQTRNHAGDIRQHATLKDAFEAVRTDPTIWKLSFDAFGSRVRLVRVPQRNRQADDPHTGWVYDPIRVDETGADVMPKKKPKPFHVICAKAGHCCFDQAYMIGRLDERNGLPDRGKPPKQKASTKAGPSLSTPKR